MSQKDGIIVPPEIVRFLKNTDSLSLVADGRTLLRFIPKETFEVKEGTLTVNAESKLKTIDNLVGLAGAYFNPILLSASNCEEVFESWNWMHKKIGVIFEQLSFWLTSHSILKSIFAPQLDLELIAPMELAVRLRKLSDLVSTKIKIREMKKFLDGNVKHWTTYKPNKMTKQAEEVIRYICNLTSEFDFALLAKKQNFEVELSKTPDMYVNKIGIEVKDLSWDPSLPARSYMTKIIDRAQKAFTQKAELAALSMGVALELLSLKSENKMGKEQELKSVLNKGLRLASHSKKPVLLFYHNPWTDDVVAQVDTMKQLRERLALKQNISILKKAYRLPQPTVSWDDKHRKRSFRIK